MSERKALTLGSLFSGSGGFELGGILAGIKPIWNSEITPFPILVTQKRLPEVKHYGDVSRLKGGDLEAVDIITFGSPCQDLSIAGQRAGIHDGKRSNLFFQAIRIIKEMREATNGQYPRYAVWENVEGALSSNNGEDFKAILEAFINIKEKGVQVPAPENQRWPKADLYLGDGWSLAYRTFDSKYWGVPQRRKRVYLIADFAGESAPQVLFKSEGMSRYTPQGFRAWQGSAGSAEEGTGETGGIGRYCVNPQSSSGVSVTEECTGTLTAQDHGNHPAVLQAAGFSTEHSARARSIGYEEGVSPTLRAGVVPAAIAIEHNPTDSRIKISEDGIVQTLTHRIGTGGNNAPLVAQPEIRAFGVCSKKSHAMMSDNPHSGFYEAETSRTLDRSGGSPTNNQGGICIVAPDPAYTLQGKMTGVGEHYSTSKNSYHTSAAKEQANTLVASDWKDPPIVNDIPNDETVYIVRRLLPVECARLQGFPDWWCSDLAIADPTDQEIEFWKDVWEEWRQLTKPDGKPKTEKQIRKWLASPYTDSAEYSLWGNGCTLPVLFFVLAGIEWAANLEVPDKGQNS